MADRRLLFQGNTRARLRRLVHAVSATPAPCGRTVMLERAFGATRVGSILRGTLQACAIKAPGFGGRRKAMLRARPVPQGCKGAGVDHDPGIRVVAGTGAENPVVLQRVGAAAEPAFGYNAATGEHGDLPLTTGCMAANTPPPRPPGGAGAAGAGMPAF